MNANRISWLEKCLELNCSEYKKLCYLVSSLQTGDKRRLIDEKINYLWDERHRLYASLNREKQKYWK